MAERFGLQRFLEAQEPVYEKVCVELKAGRKRGHWMWFIFPQFAGLGHSPTSQWFAIGSLDEARAYLEHPVLGPRLRECAELTSAVEGRTAEEIFGHVDAMKLRSSMTLFAQAGSTDDVFEAVLRRFFGGQRDPLTIQRLSGPDA